MKILDQVKDVVTGATVFGAPYEKDGVTVIPAAKVSGGGGGGQDAGEAGGAGVGVDARPAVPSWSRVPTCRGYRRSTSTGSSS